MHILHWQQHAIHDEALYTARYKQHFNGTIESQHYIDHDIYMTSVKHSQPYELNNARTAVADTDISVNVYLCMYVDCYWSSLSVIFVIFGVENTWFTRNSISSTPSSEWIRLSLFCRNRLSTNAKTFNSLCVLTVYSRDCYCSTDRFFRLNFFVYVIILKSISFWFIWFGKKLSIVNFTVQCVDIWVDEIRSFYWNQCYYLLKLIEIERKENRN